MSDVLALAFVDVYTLHSMEDYCPKQLTGYFVKRSERHCRSLRDTTLLDLPAIKQADFLQVFGCQRLGFTACNDFDCLLIFLFLIVLYTDHLLIQVNFVID